MSTHRIPFNKVSLTGNELRYIEEAVEQGHLAGDGPFTRRCSELLEQALGARKVLLTTSCTHALEMCARLLELGPGDEVIVPSFAFVTTVNAFVGQGARPVFVDIRPDTLNLDERQLEGRINERTRAIVALHYAGVGCEMDAIGRVADAAGVPVIEDAAHALFGSWRGRALGSFAPLATLSFHETKNLTCGEGGALVINDPAFVERAEIIREKGTNRSRFLRGQVDRYTWVDHGSSYLPSDILAAFLYAQLESRDALQARRAELWNRYERELRGWADDLDVRLPMIPADASHPSHMFYLLLPTTKLRAALMAELEARGILAVFHYQPLHLSEMGRRLAGREHPCPVTERVAEQLLRLPLFPGMSDAQQAEVIEAVTAFRG